MGSERVPGIVLVKPYLLSLLFAPHTLSGIPYAGGWKENFLNIFGSLSWRSSYLIGQTDIYQTWFLTPGHGEEATRRVRYGPSTPGAYSLEVGRETARSLQGARHCPLPVLDAASDLSLQ